MQFGLSEEQILLLDNVNRFLDDNSPLDRVRAYADGGDDEAPTALLSGQTPGT